MSKGAAPNGAAQDEEEKARPVLTAQPREADAAFPPAAELPGSLNQPTTTYISPYFAESFDFPWNPDPLVKGNNYAAYDEMKNDDQVKAAIAFKKDIVVNSGWRIVCEDKPEIADFITKALNEKLDSDETGKSFDDVLRDMLSAYEYGFSISEPVFILGPDNLYEYKSIKVRPPHTFRFNIDRKGKIEKIVQATDREELQLDPTKFIHHVYHQEFGNPYGKSDLRAAHPAYVAKKFFMRFFAVYVERFAGPTVVGKYKAGMTPDEITKFHNAIKSIQNTTALAVPDDVMIEFIQSQRDASDAFVKGLEMYNTWIARAILVPDLLGISGKQTSGGSYSLGQTQFRMFLSTLEKDRKSLARKVTLKLLRPVVRANFGDIPCFFEFLPISEYDELEYSKAWGDLVKSHVFKPNEDEINHFRRSVKFPEGPVVIESPMDPNDPEADPKKPGAKEKAPAGDRKERQNSLKVFRELSPYETVINFAQIEQTLDRYEDAIIPKLRAAGSMIQRDFIEQIERTGLIRNFQPETVNALQPRYMREMNQVFSDYFTGLFKVSYDRAQTEIFANATKRFADAALLPEQYIQVVQAESFKTVGDYTIEITKKGKNILMSGIKAGLSQPAIVRAVKEAMKEASERWLATVVRTKTTEMFNAARKTYWETDEYASQLVTAFEFSAILDSRTSDVCRSLDGKIFEKGGFIDRVTPPLHFNCRSLLVPITKFQKYKADREPGIEALQKLGGNLIV